jgi:hypothetical protein
MCLLIGWRHGILELFSKPKPSWHRTQHSVRLCHAFAKYRDWRFAQARTQVALWCRCGPRSNRPLAHSPLRQLSWSLPDLQPRSVIPQRPRKLSPKGILSLSLQTLIWSPRRPPSQQRRSALPARCLVREIVDRDTRSVCASGQQRSEARKR